MKNKKNIYLIGFIVLLIDQLVKLIIKNALSLNQEVIVIKNFFSIHYLQNEGAAFSIFQNKTLFLILTALICLVILIIYIQKENNLNKISTISLGLLLAGISGNLIDRLIYKKVIDFLSFTIFNYDFAVFNIADIGITCGIFIFALLFCLRVFKKDGNK